jgi:hypothetical protein
MGKLVSEDATERLLIRHDFFLEEDDRGGLIKMPAAPTSQGEAVWLTTLMSGFGNPGVRIGQSSASALCAFA